jgi:hypothetical protein
MTDHEPNSDHAVPGTKSEASIAPSDADGHAGDTIELAFTGVELDAFLRDPAMQGDLIEWAPEQTDLAVLGDSHSTAAVDELLADLRDDEFPYGGEEVLEAATRFGESTDGGDDKTFLLTEIDISDLIGDHEQVWDPGSGSEVASLDSFIIPLSTFHPAEPAPLVIEIEDGEGVTAAHILS